MDSLKRKEAHHNDCSSEERQQFVEAKEELEKWKRKVEEADSKKAKLLIEKLDSEDAKKQAEKELIALATQQQKREDSSLEVKKVQENNFLDLEKSNSALLEQLKKFRTILKNKKAECANVQLKINAEIPEKKVVFTGVEKTTRDANYDNTMAVFSITQRPTFLLKGCQALITFEEEEVAAKILNQATCPVMFGTKRVCVTPQPVTLEPSVKFEVHMQVSKRKICFSDAAPILPEEHMKDWLEACFSKPSRGGGEVVDVTYNKKRGSGQVTFLNTGVAENLTLKNKYCLDTNRKIAVSTFPSLEYQLKNFQTFSRVTKRTVLLDGIEDIQDEEDQQDILEIHFQKPTNNGGEVDTIKYLSKGKDAEAYFTEDTL
ncbi:N-myc-interactor-like [Conger conger]|uniref:N-myc-interactor-like n=1 Tax=Conger conger TaxID=82655 RepID=UPI002A5A308C|nr:N-myc-interactor-like [Conger conger]